MFSFWSYRLLERDHWHRCWGFSTRSITLVVVEEAMCGVSLSVLKTLRSWKRGNAAILFCSPRHTAIFGTHVRDVLCNDLAILLGQSRCRGNSVGKNPNEIDSHCFVDLRVVLSQLQYAHPNPIPTELYTHCFWLGRWGPVSPHNAWLVTPKGDYAQQTNQGRKVDKITSNKIFKMGCEIFPKGAQKLTGKFFVL